MARASPIPAASDVTSGAAQTDLERLLVAERRGAERVVAAREEADRILAAAEEDARRLDEGEGDEAAVRADLEGRLEGMEREADRRREMERREVAAELERLEGFAGAPEALVDWLTERVREMEAPETAAGRAS